MLDKVFIVNCGEIVLCILRVCKELGIKIVVVYFMVDKNLKYVLLVDELICIGKVLVIESYFNIFCIIVVVEVINLIVIYFGYGFLVENVDFVEVVEKSGFIFIGFKVEIINFMGDKVFVINVMKKVGVFCVFGLDGLLIDDVECNRVIVKCIGYLIIVKVVGGGGGCGMCVVCSESEFVKVIEIM